MVFPEVATGFSRNLTKKQRLFEKLHLEHLNSVHIAGLMRRLSTHYHSHNTIHQEPSAATCPTEVSDEGWKGLVEPRGSQQILVRPSSPPQVVLSTAISNAAAKKKAPPMLLVYAAAVLSQLLISGCVLGLRGSK